MGGQMEAVLEKRKTEVQDKFVFQDITCAVCGGDSPRVLGWRGGGAHHSAQGVRTRIVMCRECSHIYPNPMPFPNVSLDELYTDTDDYFHGHDLEAKKQRYLTQMKTFEQVLG